ncbi:MAG TPA: DUF1761 domain-containing protein [Candidatus Paceibacterota bacterium]|nr:DUF1761 domain-containing protein [Candidatus Paceibacterota bacterium]
MGIIRLVLAVVVFQVIGFVWYGPLFGKWWRRIVGASLEGVSSGEEKARHARMIPTYLLNLLASLVFILGYVVVVHTSFLPPLAVTIVVYFSFILPLLAQNALWSGKPRTYTWRMFLIQAGYQLLAIAVVWILFK